MCSAVYLSIEVKEDVRRDRERGVWPCFCWRLHQLSVCVVCVRVCSLVCMCTLQLPGRRPVVHDTMGPCCYWTSGGCGQ